MKSATSTRVLVVADWRVDPHAVVAACSRRSQSRDASFALLVPAWLHGLDWAGDPTASVPCAQRQLEQIRNLCHSAGLPVDSAEVGDPDLVTAIGDALLSDGADEMLLCMRQGHLADHPLDLAHRAGRASGIPTRRVAVPAVRRRRPRRAWAGLRRGHCPAAAA
jgi:hypothetical protein